MPAEPQLKAPSGACDCHMHVFDGRFPLSPKARRREPDALVSRYREMQRRLGLERVIVVQPTAYGRDNRCTLEAMAQFGDRARGIAVIDESASDADIQAMTHAGMRGVRFRMLEPPELPWESLPETAARIATFGWHVQFQMDGRQLHEREALLKRLPCPVVIEHIGKFLEPVGVEHPGFQALLRLLETGRCWVKLSGAYTTSKSGQPCYADVGVLANALVRHAPERLVWGSNWPHRLAGESALPDDALLLDLLLDWAPEERIRSRILADNPATLYGFSADVMSKPAA